MISNSTIYQNPIVPDDYYFVKVVNIESETANYIFPKMMIRMVLHSGYKMDKNFEFASILHPTQASYWHYKNFFNTFMLEERLDDYEKAVGQWGSVKMEQKEYGGSVYSDVQFCYQPLDVRLKGWEIGQIL